MPERSAAPGFLDQAETRTIVKRRFSERALAFLVVTVSGLAVAAVPALYREKPPDAHTGGFGEPTCAACHLPESNEPVAGELRLIGLPPVIDAGGRYELVVLLAARGLQVGGFQLSARFAEGSQRGRQAGHFTACANGVGISRVDSTGVEYVHHTTESVTATRDSLRWRCTWNAPEQGTASVAFHLAANASNDDASPLGDRILVDSARTRPRTAK